MKCKICSACGAHCEIDAMICPACLSPLDSVPVTDCNEGEEKNPEEIKPLILRTEQGDRLAIADGDIVGRKGVGEALLAAVPTVSRRHVRFTCREGRWYVEDLGSTNGTYLDGVEIEPNKPMAIAPGNHIGLSRRIELEVTE